VNTMRWMVGSQPPVLRRGCVLVPLATAALLFTTVGIGPAVPDAAAGPGPRGADTVRAAEFPTSHLDTRPSFRHPAGPAPRRAMTTDGMDVGFRCGLGHVEPALLRRFRVVSNVLLPRWADRRHR